MRLAVVLPGQGSQRPGMGAPWVGSPQWAVAERAREVLGTDVPSLLLDAGADELRRTDRAQLGTFVVSAMAWQALAAAGARPAVVAGHSLGELSALVAAGVLDLDDGLRLVAARGAAMADACAQRPGTMAAVLGAPSDVVARACAEVADAWPANDNAEGHVVVAGTVDGVAAATARARELGARRVLPLPVGGAFHTPLMERAVAPFAAALASATFRPAQIPVVSGVDAAAHEDGLRELLARQLTSPVRWREVTATLAAVGVERIVECGPGGVLAALAKRAGGWAVAAASAPSDIAAALA